ncbi:MAG: hypothetical protein H8E72_04790 [Candidatus Marinimicrobia bacterium]|nr:hypothetical protein [Candidatus Neomarinimicrobiota bacterium]
MIGKKILVITLFLLNSIIFGQANHDARMLGLNGSYTTMARGYQSIGVNPANLGAYNYRSVNLLNLSLGLSNNAFSITNYNAINGANLEDTLSFTYYPKSQFYDMFGGEGIRLMPSLEFPLPILNFSTRRFALTSNFSLNLDMGLPNGLLDLLLFGNPFGSNISIDMEQNIIATQDIGLSYGRLFNKFSVGFTLKYILGLFYMGMESIDTPFITTDITGFTGQNQYLIQQAIGGSGTGLDIGITTKESKEGYRFGLSIINFMGTIKWTQDHFMRKNLENTMKNSAGDFYLRPNEFMYVNMVMDSVTGTSFSETSGDPLIYYEMYKVIPLENLYGITLTNQDSALLVTLEDGTFYFPSGGEYKLSDLIGDGDTTFTVTDNFEKYSSGDKNPFQTRQPMYLRMGMSRKWEEQAIVATDLVTGFSNNYGSSTTWRASIGVEIIRFKGQFLRLGYAIGGITKKSMSLGYGRKFGLLHLDIGMSFNGGFSIETAKGIDLGMGLTWQLGKKKSKKL